MESVSDLIFDNTLLRNQLEVAKLALKFYSDRGHSDVIDGKTALIDNGRVAEDALSQIDDGVADISAIQESIALKRSENT